MSKGFTLLEVMVALFVLMIGVGGVFVLVSSVTINTSDSIARLEASYLTQEGLELVRSLRDSNLLAIQRGACNGYVNPRCWLGDGIPGTFADLTSCAGDIQANTGGCEMDYSQSALTLYANRLLNIRAQGDYQYAVGLTISPFKRRIVINEVDVDGDLKTDRLDVSVKVYWGTKYVVASTELYNWLRLPTPIRFNGDPSGTLPIGTTSITLQLETDRVGTCKYATQIGVHYDAPLSSNHKLFTATDSTSHSATISGLTPGTYSYYVRCRGFNTDPWDINAGDFLIRFTIPPPA